jgi:AraC family transcriptional regulator, activator of mtrCDE
LDDRRRHFDWNAEQGQSGDIMKGATNADAGQTSSREPEGDVSIAERRRANENFKGPSDQRSYDVNNQTRTRMSRTELDNLVSTLEVTMVKLTECLVSPGHRLSLKGIDVPGIHYNLLGTGRMLVGDHPPIELKPHTLVILPKNQPFSIEVPSPWKPTAPCRTIESYTLNPPPGEIRRLVAGEEGPQLLLICGFFRASYGVSIDLFSSLAGPIIEQFDTSDRLDQKMKAALEELVAQEVGMGVMTASFMKQVLVALVRRSLNSSNRWIERFSMWGDPQIARAFSEMAARPGAPHTVQSLSQKVGLSRTVFMARFATTFGLSPIAVLRQLRMRHAAILLQANHASIDQVAHGTGYASRSSFFRAFRKVYGRDPSEYRMSRPGQYPSPDEGLKSDDLEEARPFPSSFLDDPASYLTKNAFRDSLTFVAMY